MSVTEAYPIVGCGTIAKKHAHAIREYLDNAVIAACCDTIHERAEAFASGTGARAFSNIHDMMQRLGGDIDIVSILTPSGMHAANVLVEYGKPLVVEKLLETLGVLP